MNKRSILVTVLALSLVLLGTGYAYWTDTLNVTTKATTGDLQVKFVDLGAYAQYNNEYEVGNWSIIDGIGEGGYVDASFFERGTNTYNDVFGNPDQRGAYYERAAGYNSVEMDAEIKGKALKENITADFPYGEGHIVGDTIKIKLNNIYPGYAQAFRTDIINVGSIAAKLAKVDFNLVKGSTEETEALIGVALLVEDENPTKYGEFVKLASNFSGDDIFELGGVKFVRLSALKDLTDEEMIEIGENFILVPNAKDEVGGFIEHRADLFIGIAVDPDAEGVYTTGSANNINENNNDANSQNKGIELDIQFVWDQFNAGKDIDSTNRLEKQN